MVEQLQLEQERRRVINAEFEQIKLQQQEERHKNQAAVEELESQVKKLNMNPKARASPGPNNMDRWSVSMSLFGSLYWFDAHKRDFGTPPNGFPKERFPFPTINGNRCVVFGEEKSWFVNYRVFDDSDAGKWQDISVCSDNFKQLYPGAHQYLMFDCPNETPICVSLGTQGHYFVRTRTGVSFKLPKSVEAKVSDPKNYQHIWLGYESAFVAQRRYIDARTNEPRYQHTMHLAGYDSLLQKLIEAKRGKIAALSLNPTNRSQWAVLWPDGTTAYSREHMAFESLTYEDFCSRNFGTRWDNALNPNIGDPAEDAPFGVVIIKQGRRKILKPWKREPNRYVFGEI